MQFFVRRPWDLPQRLHTPEEVYRQRKQHRRDFLASLGLGLVAGGAFTSLSGCPRASDEQIRQAGQPDPVPVAGGNPSTGQAANGQDAGTSAPDGFYPARRNEEFTYGRAETSEADAARYTNFYEFTGTKSAWQHVGKFITHPWAVEIDGLCRKPRTFDLDDLLKTFSLEERQYRHRCVETWAMCIPWTGFPLAALLKSVEPLAAATHVAFQSFHRPEQAPNVAAFAHFPWPYTEGLRLDEAMNPLAFLATGMYGHPLWKQHGAPVRLAVPWKYGFKSIKSIVRISLVDRAPPTFWNTFAPEEYDFQANVNPEIAHPRWSQRQEWMLGTRELFPTVRYNGYAEYVASLYP
jgi:sulfoxide reductase catalytic subunit YedY